MDSHRARAARSGRGGTPTTYAVIPCPLGALLAVARDGSLTELSFHGTPRCAAEAGRDLPGAGLQPDSPPLPEVTAQIDGYFAGRLRRFDLPLAPAGTAFQRLVRQALEAVPWGETRSYGELARSVGREGAARAIGGAMNRNPIAVVVPCHRVVGADGSLTGYGAGLERKRYLLELEGIPIGG